ncbi:MAG: hypothetical protein ACTSVB_05880 [Candidatus Heimdallarchaeaceae archaeon]|uniref:Uncharacterized protein n=1 Tax=Candidatus Heimdallarchaeum endolithica TaxID=2876572 RepID=A0A9Y1BNV2_9ARCH|nr:MAG: hypothetical protein K9W46_08755 [Candidatus Heimdallarchaeum endolithica]
MSKEIRKDVSTIPVVNLKDNPERKIWNYENILTSKPRSSVREIEQIYKVVKVLKGMEKMRKYKP